MLSSLAERRSLSILRVRAHDVRALHGPHQGVHASTTVAPTLASRCCSPLLFVTVNSRAPYLPSITVSVNITMGNIIQVLQLTVPYTIDWCLLLLHVVSTWDNLHSGGIYGCTMNHAYTTFHFGPLSVYVGWASLA